MREIKFRAWHEKSNRVYNVSTIKEDVIAVDAWISGCKVDIGHSSFCEYDYDARENFILLQYTGMKDKNGEDIYEGDILLYAHGQKDPQYTVIEYHEDMFHCRSQKYKNLSPGNYRLANLAKNNEVVGNIYEDSGLLE